MEEGRTSARSLARRAFMRPRWCSVALFFCVRFISASISLIFSRMPILNTNPICFSFQFCIQRAAASTTRYVVRNPDLHFHKQIHFSPKHFRHSKNCFEISEEFQTTPARCIHRGFMEGCFYILVLLSMFTKCF